MGVTMSDDEVEEFLGDHGTAVLTTLRRDGAPVPVPVWYVVIDGAVFVRTPRKSKKVNHIARDPRVALLVHDGRNWEELRGLIIHGIGERVDDEATAATALEAFHTRFADRTAALTRLPRAIAARYSDDVIYRIAIPDTPTSWDNRKVRFA
jgi:PPOX class probable F420-dependent enzyme